MATVATALRGVLVDGDCADKWRRGITFRLTALRGRTIPGGADSGSPGGSFRASRDTVRRIPVIRKDITIILPRSDAQKGIHVQMYLVVSAPTSRYTATGNFEGLVLKPRRDAGHIDIGRHGRPATIGRALPTDLFLKNGRAGRFRIR